LRLDWSWAGFGCGRGSAGAFSGQIVLAAEVYQVQVDPATQKTIAVAAVEMPSIVPDQETIKPIQGG
jgi:hypothetical protein